MKKSCCPPRDDSLRQLLLKTWSRGFVAGLKAAGVSVTGPVDLSNPYAENPDEVEDHGEG